MEKLLSGALQLGFKLSTEQLELFQFYQEELIAWNQRVNLTAITKPDKIEIKHFLDSLTLLLILQEREIVRSTDFNIIDVGSGAGLPGLPLKIIFPESKLVLLESIAKKTTFLRHIIDRLDLENVEVVTGRAEDVAHHSRYREQFALVVSRAVAYLPSLVELTLPFCRIGGAFIAQKKGDLNEEIAQAASAISTLGGKWDTMRRVELSELLDERYLIVIQKVSPTPQQYPRRPGVPNRHPISGNTASSIHVNK